jgi:hypothetical protein
VPCGGRTGLLNWCRPAPSADPGAGFQVCPWPTSHVCSIQAIDHPARSAVRKAQSCGGVWWIPIGICPSGRLSGSWHKVAVITQLRRAEAWPAGAKAGFGDGVAVREGPGVGEIGATPQTPGPGGVQQGGLGVFDLIGLTARGSRTYREARAAYWLDRSLSSLRRKPHP